LRRRGGVGLAITSPPSNVPGEVGASSRSGFGASATTAVVTGSADEVTAASMAVAPTRISTFVTASIVGRASADLNSMQRISSSSSAGISWTSVPAAGGVSLR
jgi:hypothetical protein